MSTSEKEVMVQKGPCGYIAVNFGLGTFYIPRKLAESLCKHLQICLEEKATRPSKVA
ncbi:MAG: hypothetical protein KDD46_00185 [Bdellovibrionales bacterium]|nr:hypothetical protein [Bdellovibrionales bacterium]